MLYIKKYFTEGLIQMAILLSLCGVRVDLGLEPYLLPSWHEMMLGPTSALTQTQFHNLRNRLEDGHDLHPKSVDLDGFFTARRLLGFVHSLDRLQVPRAELETWLVQREPDPLPVAFLDQNAALVRAPVGLERDGIDPSMESRAVLNLQDEDEEEEEKEGGAHHELDPSGERGDEEEEEVEDLPSVYRHRREGGGRLRGFCGPASNSELTQNEIDQTAFSLQECLRLLEETFPFTEEQQLHNAGGREGDLEHLSSERDPMLSPIIPGGNLDMELHWQDVLAIMDPENTDADMMTNQDVRPEGLQQNCIDNDNEPEQAVPQLETPWLHDFPVPLTQPEMEPAPFGLTPSAELDDHSSALNTRATWKSSTTNSLYSPPDHRALFAEDMSQDFSLGLSAEDDISSLNMNLLPNNFADTMEEGPYPEYVPYPEIHSGFDVNFNSDDSRPTHLPPLPEGNGMTQDFLSSPSSALLVAEEDVEDEDGLPSPLNELLEDAAILDEISLLDLALEEGFSPEMAARLEEEGYLDSEIMQQQNGMENDQSGSRMTVTEDQRLPRPHQQDGEHEADSDSGLSLDFSHSPASPSNSEASTYSSSSSSSSSSCVSAEGSLLSEDEDEDGEQWLAGAHMDVAVTIKEEELDEEEMGAVGGGYPNYVKTSFSPNRPNDKMFNGFPWMEHIGHDHTYNQPWYPASSPSSGKMPTKQTKSSQRRDAVKPYHHSSSRHISQTKMWSRDERRAKALKVPFSNHLIVNLPVEEFNDLLASVQLTEEQLALIRDIRRRGKNKIAAQNCRKRKMDVLLGLSENVSGLRLYRSRLLREKQEALKKLQEMKHQLSMLYQEVFSRLRDEEGRPLNAMEYQLNFEANGSVTVASRQQGLSLTKNSKKHREKKK